MEQILSWITEHVLFVAIAGGIILILLIVCIALAVKSKNAKSTTTDQTSATTEQTTATTESSSTAATTTSTTAETSEEVEIIEVDDSKPATTTPQKEVQNIYHITLRQKDDKWQVKKQNSTKAMKLFDTQLEAINYAKTLAKSNNGSIRVHKVTGQIRKV